MKALLPLSLLMLVVACGKNGKDGKNGSDGATIAGLNGISTGIDFEDIYPGPVCSQGGVSIFTFRDANADGLFQDNEPIIRVKAICHGRDGVDGQNGADGMHGVDGANASLTAEMVLQSSQCPAGGVRISGTGMPAVEVCNGVNGINGEQGIPGAQGVPGLNGRDGADGTRVLPIKFCADDRSTFPEYGLQVGDEIFAVYWGTTPASPSTPQAFLAKLLPGQYRSTGGNNCVFRVP